MSSRTQNGAGFKGRKAELVETAYSLAGADKEADVADGFSSSGKVLGPRALHGLLNLAGADLGVYRRGEYFLYEYRELLVEYFDLPVSHGFFDGSDKTVPTHELRKVVEQAERLKS